MHVTYIADPHDFCRSCRGKGTNSYPTGYGTTLTERCDDCGGSGNKCVRVTARPTVDDDVGEAGHQKPCQPLTDPVSPSLTQ